MCHCVGNKPFKKNYRNNYVTNGLDKDWEMLLENGLALRSCINDTQSCNIIYHLITKGKQYVRDYLKIVEIVSPIK